MSQQWVDALSTTNVHAADAATLTVPVGTVWDLSEV